MLVILSAFTIPSSAQLTWSLAGGIGTVILNAATLTTTALILAPLDASLVRLEQKDDLALLSNGIITATISKSSASIRSLRFHDTEFIRQDRGGAYYSMDGGKKFRVPGNCVFRIHHQTPDLIDIAMKQVFNNHAQAVDIEIHYVIRAGVSGLHTYATVSHPASYPATSFSEWRMVWKLPDDLLDTICVDRLRFRKMPTAGDFAKAKPTDILEIVKLTTGPWAGKYDCKYDYNAEYHSTPFWGHADSRSGLGAWVKPSADYPPAAGRGKATGTFRIADPAKPDLSSNKAWIGLSRPAPGGNWQFESKNYQYWSRVAADGSFTIPPVHTLVPKIQGGNALLREGIHAKYSDYRLAIPAKDLRKGKNTLTLLQSRTHSPALHVMYDALSLEVPDSR